MALEVSMYYKAIMACPRCHGTDCSVKVDYSGHIRRNGEYVDVDTVWTCAGCQKQFQPPRSRNETPVLMCSACTVPKPHRLTGVTPVRWKDPEGKVYEGAVLADTYRCEECGETRQFGCTKRA
jgi:hypothetical protein